MEWLVYVDPSPRGEWALQMTALLPGLAQRSVCLLATAEDLQSDPALLAWAGAHLAAAAGLRLTSRPGPAERAVVEEARAHPYELVVVPPAGRGAIQRMLRGSRVAAVVRSVRRPVLVARRPPARLERVLAALSGGRLTGAVCRAALDLAKGLGTRPTFLHVASEVALPFPAREGEPAAPGPEDPAEAARAALAALGCAGELVVREGLVVDEVIAEFDSGAHHVLVVGASDPEGWAREDVTERILLRCPGSTLVVPRPEGSQAVSELPR